MGCGATVGSEPEIPKEQIPVITVSRKS